MSGLPSAGSPYQDEHRSPNGNLFLIGGFWQVLPINLATSHPNLFFLAVVQDWTRQTGEYRNAYRIFYQAGNPLSGDQRLGCGLHGMFRWHPDRSRARITPRGGPGDDFNGGRLLGRG